MSTVTCEELRARLRGGEVPNGPEVSAHVEGCADCGELLSWWGRHAPPPSAELNSAEPPPTRRRSAAPFRSFRSPSKPLVALADDAVAGRALGRSGSAAPPNLSRIRAKLQERLAAERGVRAWLRSRRTSTRIGLAVAAAGLSLAVASRRPRAVAAEHAASVTSHAAACFSYGSLFTALLLALLWALSRRDGPSMGGAALAAVGSAGVGVAGLSAHCPSSEPAHLLAGHASILVVWVVACGAWAWVAPRRRVR